MKNPTVDVILSRRSVRKFKPLTIDDASIETILKCGIYAPSAKNKQNWHFSVITKQEVIDQMNQYALQGMEKLGIHNEEGTHIFYHAPLVIVISSMIEGYSEINAGCAIENMALAAKAIGIDSCIIGQTRFMYHQANSVDINRLLKIPEGFEHDVSICFGYGDETVEASPRKDRLIDYIR